jgi:hypothetical protein
VLVRREEVVLPSAGQALAFVESVMDKALGILARAAARTRQQPLTTEEITVLRDATMLGTSIGHVGLTVRISSVRTVKAPQFANTPCGAPDCSTPNCKGNRLVVEEVEPTEDSPGVSNQRFLLDVPHHKNSGRGISMPQVPIESPKLLRLLRAWINLGRPSITSHASRRDADEYKDPETLFLSPHGLQYTELSKWYRDVHVKYAAPYPIITLQAYRSVFVTDRMEDPDRPGPSNEGAATIMGNSVRQWGASYFKNKKIKQAKAASKEMAAYRRSHLVQQGYEAEDD